MLNELGIDLDCADLSDEQKQKLIHFLGWNREMFANHLCEIGETHLHIHTIHTGQAKPVSTPPWRQTPKMRAELRRQLEEMKKTWYYWRKHITMALSCCNGQEAKQWMVVLCGLP